jgi:hypothetical protein
MVFSSLNGDSRVVRIFKRHAFFVSTNQALSNTHTQKEKLALYWPTPFGTFWTARRISGSH